MQKTGSPLWPDVLRTENIWHNISIPALNHWTCQDVEDYCGFITNPDACTEMSPIAELCCGTWEEYWAEGDDDYYDDDGYDDDDGSDT